MKLLFNRQYFRGLISLPNINAAESALSDFDLKQWQDELLIERFGADTFVELQEHLTDIDGIWHDLINGKTYTNPHGDKVIYAGLINSEVMLSPIADYCFILYVLQNYGNIAITGETTVSQQKNGLEIQNQQQNQAAARCVSSFIQVDKFMRDMQDEDSDNFADYEFHSRLSLSVNSLGL